MDYLFYENAKDLQLERVHLKIRKGEMIILKIKKN